MSQALSIRHTAADSTARLNAQSNAQAKRYRPGQAPDWAEQGTERDADSDLEEEKAPEDEELVATEVSRPVVLKKVTRSETISIYCLVLTRKHLEAWSAKKCSFFASVE